MFWETFFRPVDNWLPLERKLIFAQQPFSKKCLEQLLLLDRSVLDILNINFEFYKYLRFRKCMYTFFDSLVREDSY